LGKRGLDRFGEVLRRSQLLAADEQRNSNE
jgi:hypothetical protein